MKTFLFLFLCILSIDQSFSKGLGPRFSDFNEIKKSDIWKPIVQLIDEQKFQKAQEMTTKLIKKFQSEEDDKNWTIALLINKNLTQALHKAETAVKEFKQAKWPGSISSQILLNLYYAQSLKNYYDVYAWEINKREKIISKNKLDLKSWTKDEIFSKMQGSLIKIWELRDKVKDTPTSYFSDFIQGGNYPQNVRGTIRDAFTYFYATFLLDSTFWSAKHSNETKLISLNDLINPKDSYASVKSLSNPQVHPYYKVVAILHDLEKWHWNNDRISALIEAKLEKFRIISKKFNSTDDSNQMIKFIHKFIADYKIDPWWAEAMYLMADLTQKQQSETSLIEALEIAQKGLNEYPDSFGGRRCGALIHNLKSPNFNITTLSHDLTNKRTIEVKHKNIKTIYLRAYEFDPIAYYLSDKKYNYFRWNDIWKELKNKEVKHRWSVDLDHIDDYREHKTFITSPLKENGFYVIAASAKENFEGQDNLVELTSLNHTGLYVFKSNVSDTKVITVLDANNGSQMKNLEVSIYEKDWKNGHRFYKKLKTNKDGQLKISPKDLGKNKAYFFTVENGKDKYFDLDDSYNHHYDSNAQNHQLSLIFTDRSVYRPNQKIHFKVITFLNRKSTHQEPLLQKNQDIEIVLKDSNYEVIDKLQLKTNDFGTASGEFTIPSGRALGNWSIGTTSNGGTTNIKVEEYKRPTFLTELLDAKGDLRLNHKASFEGEAKYYYGLPVKSAKVEWKVSRKTHYPYWYRWWWNFTGNDQPQIVASGNTVTDEVGKYLVSFTPKAEKGDEELKYSYFVEVNVLDEGGETAKSEKTFIIGQRAVSANINQKESYLTNRIQAKFTISRTDLNGKGLAGNGEWELYSLKEPSQTLDPSDQPLFYLRNKKMNDDKFTTLGDKIRARWNPLLDPNLIMMSWNNNKLLNSKNTKHNQTGELEIDLGKLDAGTYRLLYKTKDKFGVALSVEKEFFVTSKKFNSKLPFVYLASHSTTHLGDNVSFYMYSGYKKQKFVFEVYKNNKVIKSEDFTLDSSSKIINLKIQKEFLGGVSARLFSVHDNTFFEKTIQISVPFVHKKIAVNLERIRKKLYPGTEETWTIKLNGFNSKDKITKLSQSAEVLAYMYDKSLDVFSEHTPQNFSPFYPESYFYPNSQSATRMTSTSRLFNFLNSNLNIPYLMPDQLNTYNSYAIGGVGKRGHNRQGIFKLSAKGASMESDVMYAESAPSASGDRREKKMSKEESRFDSDSAADQNEAKSSPQQPLQVRTNFSETAFFRPHLLTDKKGEVSLSFTVPDSLTSWNVWAHAITKDLEFGSNSISVESVKDLMVRTYLPRFFRQGDKANLKVVITNAGKENLSGKFHFELFDDKEKSLAKSFSLAAKFLDGVDIALKPSESKDITISVDTPFILGEVKLKAYAKMDKFVDGEERTLNVLPSRIHLAQSRFVTLNGVEKRTLEFKDMLTTDKSLIHNSLVVKVDGQLFYSLLSALPYLVQFPYECTEQTLNRFITTGILHSTFKKFPNIEKMAQKMSQRKTQYESFNKEDPNRKMSLIETPWLQQSNGASSSEGLLNMLNSETVNTQKLESMKKLKDAQTSSGGFPWFAGGPPSYYMTAYIIYGFAKAQEFGVEIPKKATVKAWQFLQNEYKKTIDWCQSHDSCYEMVTYLNFVASSFKDQSYLSGTFTENERKKMLEFSYKHWKRHSPQLKAMLALTLNRMNEKTKAIKVFDSIIDSAKTDKDLGTYWAPEDRSWLWYNDTIETHAFILRAMTELKPQDKLRSSLVQWLFLNKKLNHWKSTKATAEVMYSVLHYLQAEKQLESKEEISIKVGDKKQDFIFNSDEYTGKDNFLVVDGDEIEPKMMNTIMAEQKTKGMSFVSATWHYSTEKLPKEARGDFFNISRRFFKRQTKNNEVQLLPLTEGNKVNVGDQIEVHISIKSKHAAEYVHLRDPRPAGFEPDQFSSGYKWDLGLVRFEEIRDSGMNFFFENLPVGEYTLKHRLRANLSGEFRASPATLQSVYAPEFRAFSAGEKIQILK